MTFVDCAGAPGGARKNPATSSAAGTNAIDRNGLKRYFIVSSPILPEIRPRTLLMVRRCRGHKVQLSIENPERGSMPGVKPAGCGGYGLNWRLCGAPGARWYRRPRAQAC